MNGSSTFSRRAVVGGIAGALAAPAIVVAQEAYPSRPVKFITPFAAGGPADTLSRLYCARMSDLSGKPWVVENRGGAGGNVGMEIVAKSEPNGYTLGLGAVSTHAVAPTLYTKLPFDPRNSFTFVSTLWSLPNILAVNLEVPAATMSELIAVLKANPGKYSYGTGGAGTSLHLAGELLKMMAGVDIVHVPYRGTALAMQDLLAGQIQMIFDNIPGALTQARAGKVRTIAVTSQNRSPAVPDIPAIAETLPGFDIDSWTTVAGPRGLPSAVVETLSGWTKAALGDEQLRKEFIGVAATPLWRSPADTLAYRDKEEARLAPVVRASGIRGD